MAIPRHVSVLTGINQEDIGDAPAFEEYAQQIFDFLEGHIIVAHQAHFDVHFLKASLKRVGLHFQPKSVCTLRLSRKMIPNLRGFTLAHVCQYMGIQNSQAHRAWGDAHATVQVFLGLLGLGAIPLIKKEIEKRTAPENFPVNVDQTEWDALPDATGIYYLINSKKKIVYIGKAGNIRQRVAQHFKGTSKRAVALRNEVFQIQFIITGSYIIATLLEDIEIRKHWPAWNIAQKNASVWHGVVQYTDQTGLVRLRAGRVRNPQTAIVRFANQWQCRDWLWEATRKYGIDPHLCGLPTEQYVSPENHKKGIEQLKHDLEQKNEGFACLVKGPNDSKEGVMVFEPDAIRFGFIVAGLRNFTEEDIEDVAVVGMERAAVRSLITPFLMGHTEPFEKIEWKVEQAMEK